MSIIPGLLCYAEIAKLRKLKPQTIRWLAMRKDFPPCEQLIGPTKFFNTEAVKLYFRTRVDGRTIEARHINRRSRGRAFCKKDDVS